MTENKGKETPQTPSADDDDVEGHRMLVNPTVAGDMARVRNQEVERSVKERTRAKDANR